MKVFLILCQTKNPQFQPEKKEERTAHFLKCYLKCKHGLWIFFFFSFFFIYLISLLTESVLNVIYCQWACMLSMLFFIFQGWKCWRGVQQRFNWTRWEASYWTGSSDNWNIYLSPFIQVSIILTLHIWSFAIIRCSSSSEVMIKYDLHCTRTTIFPRRNFGLRNQKIWVVCLEVICIS